MSLNTNENCIEWITGDDTVTCTFSQKKFINRILSMSKTEPEVKILYRNDDGSILAKLPIKALHLTIYHSASTGNTEALLKANKNKKEEI